MGQQTANVSRNMFDERKRYVQGISQQGKPLVDADVNDRNQISYNLLRRVQQLFGDGSPNNGFLVVGTGDVNDFTIKGGDSTLDGAGQLFVKGLGAFLTEDVTYEGLPATGLAGEDQRIIFAKTTGFLVDGGAGTSTLQDSSANYVVDELIGRTLVPDIDTPGTTFSIISNTATSIVVSGDASSVLAVNNRYRIKLTTPGVNRTDAIYANCWLDEIDATEDPDLFHAAGVSLEAERRFKLETNIFVREGDAVQLSDYTDADGNEHKILKVAELLRVGGDSTIQNGMVNDLRTIISPVTTLGDSVEEGEISILRALSQDVIDDTIKVEAGQFVDIRTRRIVIKAADETSASFGPVTAGGQVRFDQVNVDLSGNILITTGSEQAGPIDVSTIDIDFSVAGCPVALVRVDEPSGVTITQNDITPVRDIVFGPGEIVDSTDTRVPTQDENDAMEAIPGFIDPSGTNNFTTLQYHNYQFHSSLQPLPNDPPNNSVFLRGGDIPSHGGRRYETFADDSASAITFNVAPPAQSRIDLLGFDMAQEPAVVTKIEGVAGFSPDKPIVPEFFYPVCFVTVDEDTTVVVDLDDIDCIRTVSVPQSILPIGALVAVTTTATDGERRNGFLRCLGETIGSAASTADFKGEQYRKLFEKLVSVQPNAGSEIFDNNDTVLLPDMRGKVIVGVDTGNVDFDTAGKSSGALTHVHTGTTDLPVYVGSAVLDASADAQRDHTHTFTTDATSSLQPGLAFNFVIKF